MSEKIIKKSAHFYPDTEQQNVIFASKAEEIVYRRLKEHLGPRWHIHYSVVLSQFEDSSGLKDNEIDFLLYHPSWGLIVLEVKGGMIGYDSSQRQFHSRNRFGKTFKIKDPFEQALVWKSRFIRLLKKNRLLVPVTHAVCLPNVAESDMSEGAGMPIDLVLGAQRLQNPEEFFRNLVKKSQPEKFLKFKDSAKQLQELISGHDFETKVHARAYLDAHEENLKLAEDFQKHFVEPIASQVRLGIEGEAGTGKSLLIKELARFFSKDESKRILVLSSNPVLNMYFKENLAESNEVRGYNDFAKDFGVDLLIAANDFEGSQEDWVQYEGPERLKRQMDASGRRFDVILCDEAQDVQPFWWEVISTMLDSDASKLYVFFDRSQGIFGSSQKSDVFKPENVLPVPLPYFPLVNNYRMTAEIQQFSSPFRTGDTILASRSSRAGYRPKLITYTDEEDARKKLGDLVKRLTKTEGLKPEEISILSARRPLEEPSILKGLKEIAHVPFYQLGKNKGSFADHLRKKNNITLSTVTRFKGLETPVSILINFSEYNLPLEHPLMSSLFYVAVTRAKHMCFVLLKEKDAKAQKVRSVLSTVESKGFLVADENAESVEQGWSMGSLVHIDQRGFLVFETASEESGDSARCVMMSKDLREDQSLEIGRTYHLKIDSALGVDLVSEIKYNVEVEADKKSS